MFGNEGVVDGGFDAVPIEGFVVPDGIEEAGLAARGADEPEAAIGAGEDEGCFVDDDDVGCVADTGALVVGDGGEGDDSQ